MERSSPPRGERGVSDDAAPSPQLLPRAVLAGHVPRGRCQLEVYWHQIVDTLALDYGGACIGFP